MLAHVRTDQEWYDVVNVKMTTLYARVQMVLHFFISSRRRHTRLQGDWSSDVCSSDLLRCRPAAWAAPVPMRGKARLTGTENLPPWLRGMAQHTIPGYARCLCRCAVGARRLSDRKSVV